VKRREFITLLGGAGVAWPLAARAQQPATRVVGWLNAGSSEGYEDELVRLRQHLKQAGFVEGQNLVIEPRWANNQYDRLPGLAAELVQRRCDVIVAATTPSVRAAKAATTTIPIVFAMAGDPVKLGFVSSLNQPGGNITSVTLLVSELVPKRLEVLHEMVPSAAVIGFLANTNNPNTPSDIKNVQASADLLRQKLLVVHAGTDDEFDTAFSALVRGRAGALFVASDPFFNSRRDRLIALSARHAIPTIYSWREFPAAGGLMSYGNSIAYAMPQMAHYVARILRGEKVSALPVQQATKVELIINLKTAKGLGLTVPPALLARADEVIE
jgi:putative tryptophan/tyrosine transport system substrate-binding protein